MLKKESYKILIIDDEQDLTNMAKIQLELSGFSVDVAFNGEEGLKKVMEFLPDLILLDIRMPDLDGFQVLQKLKEKEETAKIPVVMFTTCSQKEDKEKAYLLGAIDYLTKPVNLSNLGKQVMNVIEKKE
ncbi:MAG: response regulator [Elusimicrobiota bacterium]